MCFIYVEHRPEKENKWYAEILLNIKKPYIIDYTIFLFLNLIIGQFTVKSVITENVK